MFSNVWLRKTMESQLTLVVEWAQRKGIRVEDLTIVEIQEIFKANEDNDL